MPDKPKKPKVIRVNLPFDDSHYVFSNSFPKELEGRMDREEFHGVVRRINTEVNQDVVRQKKKVEATYFALAGSFWTVVGLLLIPYVLLRSNTLRRKLLGFHTRVKEYLEKCSREHFRARGFTWSLNINEKEVSKYRPDERYWKIEIEIASFFSKAGQKKTPGMYSATYLGTLSRKKEKTGARKGG
ncbi:MAG: uncharacterized protein A8A55_0572 [Amphiamblys sp. WSBS2006]|nr:MAG: uncharacterized protein A8A55_0572 [Amphiamblys sp. WSBS2006]